MGTRIKKADAKKLSTELGDAIRLRRKAMGIPQDELAWRVNTHRAYLGAIERGEQNITVYTLVNIAKALKAKPSDLLQDIDR